MKENNPLNRRVSLQYWVLDDNNQYVWIEEWSGSLLEFLFNNDGGLEEEEIVAACIASAEGGEYEFDTGEYKIVGLDPAVA